MLGLWVGAWFLLVGPGRVVVVGVLVLADRVLPGGVGTACAVVLAPVLLAGLWSATVGSVRADRRAHIAWADWMAARAARLQAAVVAVTVAHPAPLELVPPPAPDTRVVRGPWPAPAVCESCEAGPALHLVIFDDGHRSMVCDGCRPPGVAPVPLLREVTGR